MQVLGDEEVILRRRLAAALVDGDLQVEVLNGAAEQAVESLDLFQRLLIYQRRLQQRLLRDRVCFVVWNVQRHPPAISEHTAAEFGEFVN